MHDEPPGASWAHAVWVGAVAAGVALTAFIYGPARGYYFFADDFQWLAGARDFEWARLVTLAGRNHFYRPALEAYFAGAYRVCGLDAACFHTTNVAIHMVNVVLVAAFARVLFRGTVWPIVAAVLFAVLPAYSEAVLWISASGELLSTTFALATVLLFFFWLRSRRASAIVPALIAFALALLTHETAIVLIALLVIAAFTCGEQARVRRMDLAPAAGFVLVVVAYLAIEFTVNRRGYLVAEGHYRPGWHIISNMAEGITRLYVGRHDALSLAIGFGLVAALAAFGRGRIRLAAGWILVALVPPSLFIWGLSSRYLYLPGIGFAILMTGLIAWLEAAVRPRGTRAAVVAATAVVLVSGARFAVFARAAVRNYERVGTVYSRVLLEARRTYPDPSAGATLVLGNPDPTLVEAPYAETMLRLEYGRPDLHVTLVDAPR